MTLKTTTTIISIVLVLLVILVLIMFRMIFVMNYKYKTIMSGKKGADLDRVIRLRFKEMDQIKANAKRVTKEHKEIKNHLHSCYNKLGFVKYDAFSEMSGKLSFVIALLNDDNSGITLNVMHSRDNCYTYAKEIIRGESFIPLSVEEIEALDNAKTVEDEIKELISDDDLNFDINE